MTQLSPRVLFYVQHLLGIGHLTRASRIATALVAEGFRVTMVTGGMPVPGFPGPGVDHIALPPIAVGPQGFAALVDQNGTPIDDAFRDARRDLLLSILDQVAPDVVMTEAFPFGRRKVRFELLPLVEAIEPRRPRPLLIASLRDILQEQAKPARDQETVDLVRAHYDRVLVHGDPAFAALEDSFPLAAAIADKVSYTGLVVPPPPEEPTERFDVVVSAGGGAVGGALVRAAIGAAALVPVTGPWCVITGPNLPQADYDALAAALPAHVTLTRFRADFTRLLAGARVSVSQAGYNTVGDILRAGCASVLVPFTQGGETEQLARATRLEALDRARVVTEDRLSPEALAEAIASAGEAKGKVEPRLDGAETTARILREMLG